MADTTIEWQGLNVLQGYIRQLPEHAQQWTVDELGQAAFEAFNESQKEVPVRYGVLRASGDLEEDSDGKGWSIGYGGSAAPYALAVHEDLSAHHEPPGKAKYLEDPVTSVVNTMEGRMQATVEGAILGQLPGSPGAERGQKLRRLIRESRSTLRAVSHYPGMSDAEISAALSSIRSMTRSDIERANAGGKRTRTVHAAVEHARMTPDEFFRAPLHREEP